MARKPSHGAKQELQHLKLENKQLHESLRQSQRVHRLYDEAIKKLKAAEQAIKKSEALKDAMLDMALDCVISMDHEGRIVEFNTAAEKTFGHARDAVLGKTLADVIIPPALREKHCQGLTQCLAGKEEAWLDRRVKTIGMRADGTEFPVELSITRISTEGPPVFTGFIRDISVRKQAEEVLEQRVAEAEESRQAMLYMLEDLNEFSANIERIKQEWVQTFDAVTGPIFLHDVDGNILRANRAYAEKAGMAVEEVIGKPYWQVFPRSDKRLHSCEDAAVTGEAEEEISTDDGTVFLVHSYVMSGDGASRRSFIHWMEDITERKQGEEALMQSHEQLQKSLEGSIQAIAAAVEARDPYTAGHQRRVATLATAIARRMDLDEARIEGIHMGATIHDIGKIHLPAEILSKPAKLSDIEYSLIQAHAQVGYDILKDIVFPWPVADIAHQHHERLDGSGYPQGLKGDEIWLEARIVSVADVVEAMASHRPYRARLGVDAALEEIKSKRGQFYDPDVVDACLKIFSEKKFSFQDE